jgi:hypothetical protein
MNKCDKEMPVGSDCQQRGMTSMECGKADWNAPRLSTLEIVAETLGSTGSGADAGHASITTM